MATNSKKKRKGFFATRALGFWLYWIAAIVALLSAGMYYVSFQASDLIRHYSQDALFWALGGVGLSVVLALIKPVSQWAPLALFMAEFFSFCQFINGSYLYLTSNFFGGVSVEAILGMNFGYLFAVIAYLAVFVLSVAALFMKNAKARPRVLGM